MKIGIIGGGFIGLTTAFYLTKNGHEVTIFEKESVTGGLAASANFKGYYFEKFVHHFFSKDQEFENISAEEWVKKFMGEKAWQVIWQPLLKKKFNKDFKKISMNWFWAR